MSKIMIGTDEVLKVMFGLDEVSSLSMGGETIPITPPTPPAPVYSAMPFTIEALESGNFTINLAGVDYSTDDGNNWDTTTGVTTLNLSSGDTVQFKRNSQTTLSNGMFSNTVITFNVYGNVMSLVYGDNYINKTEVSGIPIRGLLSGCTTLVSAENLILPALTLNSYCYQDFFRGCVSLISAPAILPATTLTENCYQSMFRDCTNLTTAPELPATILAQTCYASMFRGCSSLNYIKCLATDMSAASCLDSFSRDVSATGTFVKAAGVTWPSGRNGIPTGWTVVNV